MAEGRRGRAIFGSVADRVARTAPVPILILRTPDEDADHGVVVTRIVVPLDGSEIAERALPVASELARQLAAPVHVVRAVDAAATLPLASGVFGAAPVVAEVTDQIWEEAEAEARSTVTRPYRDCTPRGSMRRARSSTARPSSPSAKRPSRATFSS